MTDPTPKPEPIPSDAQIAQWEASTAMALRVLRVLAEVTTSGELASSGYLRKRCGLSAEEWHGSGELMASLICFASDKGFLEWHARDMVDATSDPKPEPQVSELEDRIADAVIDFYSNHSSDGLELYAPAFTRVGLKFAISTSGLAELEANFALAGERIEWTVEDNAKKAVRIADLRRQLEEAKDEAQKWRESFGRIQRTFDHTEGERIEACEKSATLRRQLEEAREWKDIYHQLCTLVLEAFTINEGKINLVATLQAEIERLREAAREVLRISDRKHDAWDRLRAALAQPEEKESS